MNSNRIALNTLSGLFSMLETARADNNWPWATSHQWIQTVDSDFTLVEMYVEAETVVITLGQFVWKPSDVHQFTDFGAALSYLAALLDARRDALPEAPESAAPAALNADAESDLYYMGYRDTAYADFDQPLDTETETFVSLFDR